MGNRRLCGGCLILVEAGDAAEQRQGDVTADNRRRPQQLLDRVRQRGDPVPDHHAHLPRRLHQRIALGLQAQLLHVADQEEGNATRSPSDRRQDGALPFQVGRHHTVQELLDVGIRERTERMQLHQGGAGQVGQ